MELRYTPAKMQRMLDETITELLKDPEMQQHAESLHRHRAALSHPEALTFLIQLVMYLEDHRENQ